MSYCRWSSDGFQCDVYVYGASEGYTIHVAGNRRPRRVTDVDFASVKTITATMAQQRQELDDSTNAPVRIGLSEDGKTFVEPTPRECAERLTWLQSLGYNVPQDVINELRAEAGGNDEIEGGDTVG